MFTPLVRMILVMIGCCLALHNFLEKEYSQLVFILVAIILIVLGYFKNGTIYLTCRQLKKGNYSKATQLLKTIKNPNLLSTSQKGYYHYAKGLLNLEAKKLKESKINHLEALKIGLRTNNDKGIVYLNLAIIEAEMKELEAAKNYLAKVRPLTNKEVVLDAVRKLEAAISAEENKES